MRRQLLNIIAVFLIFLISEMQAQTVIPAKAMVSGVWTLAEAPFIIEGEAIIPQNSTLTIEAGVEVRFKTGTNDDYLNPGFDLGFLRISGKLTAKGSAQQPIVLTRDGSTGRWGNLLFDTTADSSSTLKYCRINYASQVLHASGWLEFSGAVSVYKSYVNIENCLISNNFTDGLFCDNASPRIVNCLITDNGHNGFIGTNYANPQFINCTFSGNPQYAIDCGYNSSLTVSNSILWGNGTSFAGNLTSAPKILYSLVEESTLPAGAENLGGNLFTLNPRFADTTGQDYALQSNSFCINSGNPDTTGLTLPAFDLNGQVRIRHERVDMGAYEYADDYLRVVSPNGLESWKIGTVQQIRWYSNAAAVKIEYTSNDGNSWSEISASTGNNSIYDWLIPDDISENCRIRISDASNPILTDLSDTTFIIDDKTIISDGLQVYGNWTKAYAPYVIKGEAIVPKDSTLIIEPGVEVRFACGTNYDYQDSGFDMGLLKVNGRLIAEGTENDSILFTRSGTAGNWGVIFCNESLSDTNSIQYAHIAYGSRCDNLIDTLDFSGAVSVYSAGLKIRNSRIENNEASAIHSTGTAGSQISANEISNNGAHGLLFSDSKKNPRPFMGNNLISSNAEGGIYIKGDFYATIENNRIESNGRDGIYSQSGFAQTRAANNIIRHNQAGINVNSFIEIVGNLFAYNNQGLLLNHVSPQIMNNTFADNSAAGIYCEESSPYITNCIFSDNNKDFSFKAGDASTPTASYSLFKKFYLDAKVTNGGGNRTGANPGFLSSGDHPFALKSNSAAIDAGTNENALVTLPENDLAGKPRVYDGDNNGSSIIDIGAYEFSALSAGFAVDKTFGTPPLTVNFSDHSVGEIDHWVWYFGDGDSSSAENPQHIYNEYGIFSVTLSVSGPLGTSIKTEPNLIVVEHAPQVNQSLPDTSFTEDGGEHYLADLNIVFSDADSGDVLNYSLICDNPKIQLTLQNDSLVLNSSKDYFGRGTVVVTASDSYGLTATDTFMVTITALNDPPVIDPAFPDSLRFTTDSLVTLPVWDYVSDVESQDSLLTYLFSVSNDSLRFAFNDTTGFLTLWSQENFLGRAKLYVTVKDDSGASARDSAVVWVESTVGIEESRTAEQPESFRLLQNYPNPFNPVTIIRYQLSAVHFVELAVYNTLGQKMQTLVHEQQGAGLHSVHFKAEGLSSGVYFYRLSTNSGAIKIKKMILIR